MLKFALKGPQTSDSLALDPQGGEMECHGKP